MSGKHHLASSGPNNTNGSKWKYFEPTSGRHNMNLQMRFLNLDSIRIWWCTCHTSLYVYISEHIHQPVSLSTSSGTLSSTRCVCHVLSTLSACKTHQESALVNSVHLPGVWISCYGWRACQARLRKTCLIYSAFWSKIVQLSVGNEFRSYEHRKSILGRLMIRNTERAAGAWLNLVSCLWNLISCLLNLVSCLGMSKFVRILYFSPAQRKA